jgi:hypothetical protein
MAQMFNPLNYPILMFVGSVAVFWLGAQIGTIFHSRYGELGESTLEDFKLVLGATLTLLGLIIGFTFSMAVSRYDQRKNLEEQEANAIGTEYVRADFLPTANAARVRALLKSYLYQRILFYTTSDGRLLEQNNVLTARLQEEMWSEVKGPTSENPTPVAAIVAQGMNDVLNSQGYSQAAWWNRIPVAAWILLITIGILCNALIGYLAHDRSRFPFWILPIFLAISLFLIADIDSPRRGVIRVRPQNLENLANSLRSQ